MIPLMHTSIHLAALAAVLVLLGGLWRHGGHIVPDVSSSSLRPSDSASSNHEKVKVQVSIESLCIDSKVYILQELVPTFCSPLSEVMDLEVVVFGNAQLHTDRRTVTCQHGEAECDANVYEQCAINNFVYPSRYLPFLACLFENLPMGHAETAYDASYFAQCARVAALDFSTIAACHTMDAWAMQIQSATRTPPHDHVPWLMVDGVATPEDKSSLATIVCDALAKKGGQHSFCETIEV